MSGKDSNIKPNDNKSAIERTSADDSMGAYYDRNFELADTRCCSCGEPTLNQLDECKHPLCESCIVQWRDTCFRKGYDYTCPLCRRVISKYVRREGAVIEDSDEDEDEDEDDNMTVVVYENGGDRETFPFDTTQELEVVDGKFPNLRFAIAVLFHSIENDDMNILEGFLNQFIETGELDGVLDEVLIKLFDNNEDDEDVCLKWICDHVDSVDYHKTFDAWDDESLITHIMRYGYYDIARSLFERNICDINENSGGDTLLSFPIQTRDYPMMEFMIAKGADLNCDYDYTHTLDYALQYSAPIEVVQSLIDRGSNVNWTDQDDHTLLTRTIYREYGGKDDLMKSYIKILLSNGCDDTKEQWINDPETGVAVKKVAFDFLENGTFTRAEWERMKPMILRSGRVLKRKRDE